MWSHVLGEPFANKDTKLLIAGKVLKQLVDEGQSALPREYSALLAGAGNRVTACLPAPVGQPGSFAWSGPFLLEALKELHQSGLAWLGVIHTHPAAPAVPSRADAAGWHYPSLAYAILSYAGDEPELKLYRMESGRFVPHPYEIMDGG